MFLLEAADKRNFAPSENGSEKYNDIANAVDTYIVNREIEGKRNSLLMLLEQLHMICGFECTPEQAFDIARTIDDYIDLEEPVPDSTNSNAYFVRYSALNIHFTSDIRILPVLDNTFMTRSQANFSNDGYPMLRNTKASNSSMLGSYFKNYIIMEKGTIEEFPVNVSRVRGDSGLGKYYEGKNNIKLTLIPFTQVDLDEIQNIRYEGRYFSCEGMKSGQEERLLSKQKRLFELLAQENATDFIIFPEMLFTENMTQCSIGRNERPEMVVNGSVWEDGYNYSTICLCGNEVYKHYKRCPYIAKRHEGGESGKEREYQEKLNPLGKSNKTYNIIEAGSFGRIAIGICKDIDDPSMLLLWRMLRVNLLLVPAFSSSADLESTAESLASLYNIIVVLCNACSAVGGLKEEQQAALPSKAIGFIALPARKGKKRTSVLEYYYKKDTCSSCVDVCMGHKAIIKFDGKRIVPGTDIKTFDFEWIG